VRRSRRVTRSRADSNGIVGEMTVAYYAQRASAGLILSEAINISADALGSPLTPGLFNEAQIAAWQKVTAAVHEKGGLIYAQLWHTGRVAHSYRPQWHFAGRAIRHCH